MITIEGLRGLGANVDEGMARCLNKEDFYLKLVNMALADDKYGKLRKAVEENNTKEGFEYAHALKGMLANVSLTNILEPVVEITEGLRHGEELDYAALLDKMDAEYAAVMALAD